ncbi:septum site-determining protein MinC [Curvibacter sp. RS43]|uniref:Probable septum site-determining protein MinC n=1 Tax=Curvibacter microcysteis TaxID=3026419 RepID=A0ABT5MD60_9BURK|nr:MULTISPECIES: septum site-determining protein MinC [unclassified Curvibacter]MDD0811125.1 septum site-determining protein MinC [Curvibacter sp. RS43]MDD0813904.1 septum site-determining protein MinC [Curvibacter sp. HBC28]
MTGVTSGPARAPFDFKSATLPLVALLLKTTDQATLEADLARRMADAPDFFSNDPLVIDLSAVRDQEGLPDFAALIALLRRYRVLPIAVRGGQPAQMAAAVAAGLIEVPDLVIPQRSEAPQVEVREVIREVEVPVQVPVAAPNTVIIDKPLRSGQQVYARGGDIVVLALVSNGAEVIADGNVHVYAPLRGKAVAGARGNTEARIFSTCLEAELISIAGIYRTTEVALPPEVAGKAAQIRLVGEKLVMEAL